MPDVAGLLDRTPALTVAKAALSESNAWLVGGSVRDLVLDRAVDDVDLAVDGDPEATARALGRAVKGPVFPLSEKFGAWRVLAPGRAWQADVAPLRGGSITSDLALRDFTINAMAVPLASGGPLLDPHGGRDDAAAGRLRMVAPRAFEDDPLRVLRIARLACELDLEVEQATIAAGVRNAAGIARVSPERAFYELRRLLVADGVLRGIELMDRLGLIALLLPELEALKGVEQNPYHHLDVWGHTVAVLDALLALEREPGQVFGEHAGGISEELARPLADDLTRWQALRLGALFHDAGKPGTRTTLGERVLFVGHDELGARLAREGCGRFRTSSALADFVADLARHHLRLGFLVRERPLTRRHVYGYLRSCEPVEVEVTVLSVADRLATRGERTREEAIQDHLTLARELAGDALAWRRHGPPRPLVRGDELISALGLEPGPQVGGLLEQVRAAAYAGELSSRSEAIEYARRELDRRRGD